MTQEEIKSYLNAQKSNRDIWNSCSIKERSFVCKESDILLRYAEMTWNELPENIRKQIYF